jgi:hypothetical protein
MKQLLSIVVMLSTLLASTRADWQYRSRSDLAPSRLNITIPATKDVEPGYLFIAPFAGFPDTPSEQHGPRQAGPYIFRDDGDLVWSGYGIYSIWASNFQAGRWKGKDVLFSFEGDHNAGYGHGHGHMTFLDQHYEIIRELRAGNHKLADKHEFKIVDEQTGLIQVYQPVPKDLTEWGAGPDQQWIVNAMFQGLCLWRWYITSKTDILQNSTSSQANFSSNGPVWIMYCPMSPYFPSTRGRLDQATTVPMLGTTSTLIVLTKTLMGTTSSPLVTHAQFTRSMGPTARSFG